MTSPHIDAPNNIELAYHLHLLAQEAHQLEKQPGQIEAAEKKFRLILEKDPNHEAALSGLAGITLRKKLYLEARELYTKLLNINSQHDFAEMGLGYIHFILGELEQAEVIFKNTIARRPHDAEPHVALGWMYNDHGNVTQAFEEFKAAHLLNPQNDGALEGLGFICFHYRVYDDAKKYFHLSIEINGNNGGSHVGLGNILVLEKQFTEAKYYFDKALQISPYDESAYNGKANIHKALKEHSEAEKNYRLAMQYTPAQPFSYIGLGELLLHLDRREEAKQILKQALDLLIHPGDMQTKVIRLLKKADSSPGLFSWPDLFFSKKDKSS